MNKKLLIIPALMLVATVGFTGIASADSEANIGVTASGDAHEIRVGTTVGMMGKGRDGNEMSDQMRHMMSGVFGTVTAVNGSTITVQTKAFTKGTVATPATTYTVNISSSTTIDKNKTASSITGIAIGDTVIVEGTVNGTIVTATKIHDGVMMKGQEDNNGKATILDGNGQPVIGGTVTAVSGNTITITNKSNVSYTIDATNAKITKNGVTSTASTITVGDTILTQGTINGNTVAAVNIIDGTNASGKSDNGQHLGFFGSIGGFFSRIFGFGK